MATLRQFVRPKPVVERCELCSAELAPAHQHLLELKNRQIVCSCNACAILFDSHVDGKFRRVPRLIQTLSDFQWSDVQWESMNIPINLAFFFKNSAVGKAVALYPGPAGATESFLTDETWDALVAANPILRDIEPDVEALLVNRVGQTRDYYRVPIDECYKLVGLIRIHWRGLSGGTEVWRELAQFFKQLSERSSPSGGPSLA